MGINDAPILTSTGPFCGDIHHCQIQNLQKVVVGGKDSLRLRDFTELTVIVFNGIGRVDKCSDLLWVLEIGAQIGPVIPPGLSCFLVFGLPFFFKAIKLIESGFLINGSVYALEV